MSTGDHALLDRALLSTWDPKFSAPEGQSLLPGPSLVHPPKGLPKPNLIHDQQLTSHDSFLHIGLLPTASLMPSCVLCIRSTIPHPVHILSLFPFQYIPKKLLLVPKLWYLLSKPSRWQDALDLVTQRKKNKPKPLSTISNHSPNLHLHVLPRSLTVCARVCLAVCVNLGYEESYVRQVESYPGVSRVT